jgi:hypothetical protein
MTNKNKEHCEVGCDSKNFPRGRSPHSSSSLSNLTRVVQPSCLVPLFVQVGPGRGQLVSRQCFSLDRGVCSFDIFKDPRGSLQDARVRQTPLERLRSDQSEQDRKKSAAALRNTHHPLPISHVQSEKGTLHKGRRKPNPQ